MTTPPVSNDGTLVQFSRFLVQLAAGVAIAHVLLSGISSLGFAPARILLTQTSIAFHSSRMGALVLIALTLGIVILDAALLRFKLCKNVSRLRFIPPVLAPLSGDGRSARWYAVWAVSTSVWLVAMFNLVTA
jgi:hypothetical protein